MVKDGIFDGAAVKACILQRLQDSNRGINIVSMVIYAPAEGKWLHCV